MAPISGHIPILSSLKSIRPAEAVLPGAVLRTVLMDSDKRSAQIERLEVVEMGRRRRWSEDEKLKIVLETLQAPRQVSATARRYGVSRSLLLKWRRSFRAEQNDPPDAKSASCRPR